MSFSPVFIPRFVHRLSVRRSVCGSGLHFAFLLTFFLFIFIILFSYRWVCAKHHYQQFFSYTITINGVLAHVDLRRFTVIIPALYFRKKKEYDNFIPRFVHRLSVRRSVRASGLHFAWP